MGSLEGRWLVGKMGRAGLSYGSLAARPKHFLPHAEQSPGGVGSSDLSGGFLEFDFGGVAEGVEGRSEIRD